MRGYESPAELSGLVRRWFATPLGQSVQAMEVHRLRDILPRLYGPVALQLGRVGSLDMLDGSLAATRVVVDASPSSGPAEPQIVSLPEGLPFADDSVDVVLLPHTLDFASEPHQILREVSRITVGEGHVVVVGFNPFSVWGLCRMFHRRRRIPWRARFFSAARVKDWLQLLGFEVTGAATLFHRPPIGHDAARDRLFWLERLGDRWWPPLAAVYVLVGRKHELGITALRPRWKEKKVLAGRLTEPLARGPRHGHG
jgi:SAM-dependent methyltransferase